MGLAPSGMVRAQGRSMSTLIKKTARVVLAAALLLVLLVVVLVARKRPDRALRVATANVAQTLCAYVFVSGQTPAQAFAENIAPLRGMHILLPHLHYTVDTARRKAPPAGAAALSPRRPGIRTTVAHCPPPRPTWPPCRRRMLRHRRHWWRKLPGWLARTGPSAPRWHARLPSRPAARVVTCTPLW